VSVAAAVVMLTTMSATYQSAMATSLTTAIIALSLVVVTGYSGQISLMQAAFMGLGGLFTAKFASELSVPFPLSIILAAVIMGPLGALLGAPALRVRGLGLAVVTLAAAIAVDAVVFQSSWAGGGNGQTIPTPTLWGFSLESFEHPVRYGIFTLIVLVLVALAVGNLRRGAGGRQMLAIRSNERAAAVVGVNVAAVKLKAFAMASAIAAIGGGVLAYSNPFFVVGNGQFGAMPSISLATIAYMGGIASVAGGVVAGVICAGGLVYVALSGISGFANYYLIISGVGLIWTVIANPDGIAPLFGEHLGRYLPKLARRRSLARTEPPTARIRIPSDTRPE
jgi:ABC-type branched-subunit amino acid transport system permease subunit